MVSVLRRHARVKVQGSESPGEQLRDDPRSVRLRDERGVAALEFALILPALLLLIFGIFEGGFAMRDLVSIRNTAEDAAREGSVGANSTLADFKLLKEAKARITSARSDIDYIVVYKATGPGQEPTATCKAGVASAIDKCNVYLPADFNRTSADFGCGFGSRDASWCPTTRNSTLTNPDWIGVYVKAKHKPLSGFFPGTMTITRTFVVPLERGGSV